MLTIATKTKSKSKKDLLKADDSVKLTAAEKAMVDEFTVLSGFFAGLKAKQKRHDELKGLLSTLSNEKFDAKEPAVLRGNTGIVQFTPAGDTREIADMQGLIGAIREKHGYETLIKLVTITLGNVDSVLTDKEAKPFIKSGTGPRRFASATEQ